VLSHLLKTYLDGASFVDRSNPVIIYTKRYDRVDNFWWTITHEIAHILLHFNDETNCFIDNLDEKSTDDLKEIEADKFTKAIFNEDKILQLSKNYSHYLTKERLKKISNLCGIDISIILGILQYNGIINYRVFNKYKKKVSEFIPINYVKG